MNVVVHAPTGEPDVLGNVENLLADGTVETESVVVAHGGGLDVVLAGSEHADQVRGLLAEGVDVAACRNTIDRRGVTAADLVEGVRVVPSGVGELVRLQGEGYAYLRP